MTITVLALLFIGLLAIIVAVIYYFLTRCRDIADPVHHCDYELIGVEYPRATPPEPAQAKETRFTPNCFLRGDAERIVATGDLSPIQLAHARTCDACKELLFSLDKSGLLKARLAMHDLVERL